MSQVRAGSFMVSEASKWAMAATLAILPAAAAKAQTAMVPSTKDFVAAAAQSDHFEITEAQTALAQSHDPGVRAFAQEMIQAHTRTSHALQSAAVKGGVGLPPPGLSGDQQKMLSALQSQRGADFDRTYLKQQVLGHQVALVLEHGYAAEGENPDVRQAARAAVHVIQRHLAMAQQLRNGSGKD